MQGFHTMLKVNMKLLLRNKGYLTLLVVLPIISIIMLNINIGDAMFGQDNSTQIKEMSKDKDEILKMENTKLSIKVYDCNNTELSDYVIRELAKTGSYYINRFKSPAMELDEAREKALNNVNHSVIGAVIYIPDNFEKIILEGKESNLVVFEAVVDKRIELLESNLNAYLQSVTRYASMVDYDKAAFYDLLETSVNSEIKKNTVSIEVGDSLNLNMQQKSDSSSIGFSLTFLSITFLFSGVFIASTVIEERHNRVYNRFILSTASLISYGMAKLVMVLMTVIMQTGIMALGIRLIVHRNFGISFINYLFMVFCLGLIFNLLSVVIGVLTDNVLTSNYITFIIWTLSCLLAGLYFPLDGASKWWARVSMLMPQRWVVKASELLMAGKGEVFSSFLLVMVSYLILIGSVGLIGIKVRRKE